jgi:hypothetical protein
MSSGVDPKRLADNYRPQFGLDWVPVLPRDQLERMSAPELIQYHNARKQAEAWAGEKPVANGWVLPSWRKVMDNWKKYPIHIILGGVRSSKSSFASRLCVWGLGNIPEAEIRCYHVNERRSKEDQQRFIWDALPQGLKNMGVKRGQHHAIRYNQGTGFTNDMLIVPPLVGCVKGGQIDFSNYRSFEADNKTAEGFKSHIIWGDEEMPVKLFETLIYRLTDYHGRMILTFTTLEGWTPLVQDILGEARTLESRYSDLVGKQVPVLQESISRPGALIHYFWTSDNPFLDEKEFRQKLEGRSEDEILARAHGIPTKAAKAVFTLFDRNVNVVKHDNLPWIKNPNYPVTRYMAIDPAGAKNWFILWVAVDAAGTWWVYREWPDRETYGKWAEPAAAIEGKAGPAQKSLGFGIKEYVSLIKELEAGEEIFERLIDPRMGAAEKQSSDEGATTIISDLEKHEMTVIPAPGVDIDNGIQLLQGLLSWKSDKPRDSLNSPHYFVSDRCGNHTHSMSEYSAKAGPQDNLKDPIDPARYLAVANIQFFDRADMVTTGTEL